MNKDLKAQTWLPFHRIIVGLALEVWPDLFLTPRVVSFIFGILSLISLAWLSNEIFYNKAITVIASFLGAVFAPRVLLSVVPLAEIMFIFMLITGSAFFARWLNQGNKAALLSCTALFALSTTIRYEGWAFSASLMVILLVLYFSEKNMLKARKLWLVCAILAAFPVFWVGLHTLQTGNPLGFISKTANRYRFWYGDSFTTVLSNSVLVQFVRQNLMSFNLIGVVSIIYLSLTDRCIKKWMLVPSLALLIMTLLSLISKGLPTHNFWRIPAIWSILLVPFTAHWVYQQKNIFSRLEPILKNFLLLFVFLLIEVIFLLQTSNMSLHSGFSKKERAVGQYLNQILSTNSNAQVLIETSDFAYVNIVIASQHLDNFIYNSGPDPIYPANCIVCFEQPLDGSKLKEKDIRFLVFRAEPYKNVISQNTNIVKLKDFSNWTIYEFRR